jgi:HK97 gp10 family phage protein
VAEFEVEGLRALVRKLEQAGTEVSDLKQAFNRIANIVVYEAKALAPKRSGALAASIRAANSKNKSVIRAGGARIPYAMPIHWGWPRRNIAAQPFMNDAIESKRQAVMDQFELELRRLVAKLNQ